MLRLIMGVVLGVYLGFNAPKLARVCRDMGECCFRTWHDEAHREDTE